MNSAIRPFILASVLLLFGCPKDKSSDGADATNTADGQLLAEIADSAVAGSDATEADIVPDTVADAPDLADSDDATPELPPADTPDSTQSGSDTKVYIYVPADPCAEEQAAPAEGSACTTVDELRCSDFQQKSEISFTFQTSAGSHVAQVCKRLYVLRCEPTNSGSVWVRHSAADLVGSATLAAAAKTEGIWCMNSKTGVALEPGVCADANGGWFKACPTSLAGMLACSGSGLGTCGTPDVVDALVSAVPGMYIPPNESATKRLGQNLGSCSAFARRYAVANCPQKTISCKYTKPNGEYYFPSVPTKCVINDEAGAYCATTCEEIGMEGPPKW